jgi:hypothetical protein
MIVVRHLNGSRSQRILWLVNELRALYEVAFYQAPIWRRRTFA